MDNLAPQLIRQRVMIEALTPHLVLEDEIKDFLIKLSAVLNMRPLREPFAYQAGNMGYGGWIHWITSGAHVYSYPAECTGVGAPLLTLDAYTCKPFDVARAVDFTREYFGTDKIEWKEV